MVVSGCSNSGATIDIWAKLDKNKNEYRVFPLDVKKVDALEE